MIGVQAQLSLCCLVFASAMATELELLSFSGGDGASVLSGGEDCVRILQMLDPLSDSNVCNSDSRECPEACAATIFRAKACVGTPVIVGTEQLQFDVNLFIPLLTRSFSSHGSAHNHALWHCIEQSGGKALDAFFPPLNKSEGACGQAVEALRLSRLSVCDPDANREQCGDLCSHILVAVQQRCGSKGKFQDREGNERSIANAIVQQYLLEVVPSQCACELRRNVFGEAKACVEVDNDAGLAMFASSGYMAVLLLVGFFVRCKVRALRQLCMPTSLVGGLIGLAIKECLSYTNTTASIWVSENLMFGWEAVAGFLINVIFAPIFIGFEMPSRRDVWGDGGPQLCFGELLNMGQYVIGISLSMLLSAFFAVPGFSGFNLPMAFVGGHSNCFAIKDAYVDLGWDTGKDVCLLAATSGLVGGVVFGVLAVNICRYLGKIPPSTRPLADENEPVDELSKAWSEVGVIRVKHRERAGSLVTESETIESMALQAAIVFAAIFLAYMLKRSCLLMEELSPFLQKSKVFSIFPFFSFSILAGMLVNWIFNLLDIGILIDRPSIDRISGLALEVLLLCAIASTNIAGVLEGLLPLMVIIFAGFLYNAFMCFFVAPRFFSDCSYHRGFFEFGCCSGTTPIGLLLMNMVDPQTPQKVQRAISIRLMIDCPIIGIYLSAAIVMINIESHGTLILLCVSSCMWLFWLAVWCLYFRPSPRAVGSFEDQPRTVSHAVEMNVSDSLRAE